jgi:hypothetical protein
LHTLKGKKDRCKEKERKKKRKKCIEKKEEDRKAKSKTRREYWKERGENSCCGLCINIRG